MTLRELREQRGLSLLDVERDTGIHRGTLSKIERGIETPKAEQLAALSQRYGVDPAGWRAIVLLDIPAPKEPDEAFESAAPGVCCDPDHPSGAFPEGNDGESGAAA